MQTKLLDARSEKTWAVVFQTGDEVVAGLKDFARNNRLGGSHFTAIGAFSDVTLAFFDWQTKDYRKIPLPQQVEVLSLIGDIALNEDGSPQVHAHIVVGLSDGTVRGGHLIDGHVRPTLEVILVESPEHLRRKNDPETGLALIDLSAS